MVKYTITYFNYRWLAEPARYILTYGGADFEDVRLEYEEVWQKNPDVKKKYPYARVPLLEDSTGFKLSQSFAIARYLGNKFGLGGSTPEDNAKIDEYADVVKDILKEMELMWTDDEKRKAEAKTNLLEKTIPGYFTVVEERLKENGGKYLVGNSLTWVDIMLAHWSEIMGYWLDPNVLDKYPAIKAHQQGVFEVPKIKAWIDKRPPTQGNL